jgi:hypothetical protein
MKEKSVTSSLPFQYSFLKFPTFEYNIKQYPETEPEQVYRTVLNFIIMNAKTKMLCKTGFKLGLTWVFWGPSHWVRVGFWVVI